MVPSSQDLSTPTLEALAERLNNWRRWPGADELGTINYITDKKIAEAARLVETGKVFALGVPLDRHGPQQSGTGRFNPIHLMTEVHTDPRPGGVGVADDVLFLPPQASTQWDALGHVSHRGRIYGDRSAELVNVHGAAAASIRAISARVVSRGVLVDLPRHLGVKALEPGYAITVRDLEAVVARERTVVGEGDVLLVRTGFMQQCRDQQWQGYTAGPAPGLGVETLEWIHGHRLAAIATDTAAVEVRPWQVEDVFAPFHVVAIVYMGLLLGEIFDLDELALDCTEDERYEFLFVAPPLPITGGVGSPINPYAIK